MFMKSTETPEQTAATQGLLDDMIAKCPDWIFTEEERNGMGCLIVTARNNSADRYTSCGFTRYWRVWYYRQCFGLNTVSGPIIEQPTKETS